MDAMPTDLDLSIAQVEAELRAAEAYLTTATGDGSAAGQTQETTPSERTQQPIADTESSYFQRPARARTAIPEDRRKEILAKLSSERQAAVRGHRSPFTTPSMRPLVEEPPIENDVYESYRVEEQFRPSAAGESDDMNRTQYYGDAANLTVDEGEDEDQGAFDDEGEVFYASDVIGKSVHEDIQPRTALDIFNVDNGNTDSEGEDAVDDKNEVAYPDDADELKATVSTNYRPTQYASEGEHEHQQTSSDSLLARVLARREDWYKEADMHISHLLKPASGTLVKQDSSVADNIEAQQPPPHPTDSHMTSEVHAGREDIARDPVVADDEYDLPRDTTIATRIISRLEVLAQPRTRTYAEREKQRLVNELEALNECTFQPQLLKRAKPSQTQPRHNTAIQGSQQSKKGPKSVKFAVDTKDASGRFPWLTLSPRRRSTTRTFHRDRQSLIDRLNLDVTVKYEARQRLREMLEAEKMRECTFQPKINPLSRRLLSRTDYKPIHERISEVQREKVEYIQRVREELAYEEGACTFTPQINSRSREIAEAVLSEKQVSKIRASRRRVDQVDEHHMQAMLRPPAVTERLIQDAEQVAEKRVAVQEYYDALEEKAFAPVINETSSRLVEERPEFKLDFISRQEYFRMVEQEKLEALEDIVNHEQELTFRPHIGNAEKVLQELRPDLAQETSQQRLDRLVYHEPRRKEMIQQRLREEEYGKLSFKPEINSVSKALAEKAKAEVAARANRRHELQRYFAGKQFRSRVAKELELAEKAECTFRPQLNSRPKVKSSSTSKLHVKQREQDSKSVWRSDNILHTIETQRQQRAEGLEAKRNALELKELENCTFQPNLHRPPRRALSETSHREEKPVVVRGLGRFLELKERAKRQQEEKKQREEKVFNPNHTYEPRSYTVPKPFKLSEASKDSIRRRLKLREQMRSKERSDCTFTPRTLEARQRQVLRALLKDHT